MIQDCRCRYLLWNPQLEPDSGKIIVSCLCLAHSSTDYEIASAGMRTTFLGFFKNHHFRILSRSKLLQKKPSNELQKFHTSAQHQLQPQTSLTFMIFLVLLRSLESIMKFAGCIFLMTTHPEFGHELSTVVSSAR